MLTESNLISTYSYFNCKTQGKWNRTQKTNLVGCFRVFLPLDICTQGGPKSWLLNGRTTSFLTACFPHLRRTTQLSQVIFLSPKRQFQVSPWKGQAPPIDYLPLVLVSPTPSGLGVSSNSEQLAVPLEQTRSWAVPGQARHSLDPWKPTRGSS